MASRLKFSIFSISLSLTIFIPTKRYNLSHCILSCGAAAKTLYTLNIHHLQYNQKIFQSMAAADEIIVLEHIRISPPSGSTIGKKLIPLTYFDVPWLFLHPIHQLCFYEYSHPKSHFIETVIPNLKQSLSVALQRFFPLAGNLIVYPFTDSDTTPRKPEISYEEGDSVSLTIAECTKDFGYLTGNHARKADEFYPLVPKLGDITRDSDTIKVALLAIQVTLFQEHGICIGITSHHAACDGNARVNFLRAWASITKFGDDKAFLASQSLPFFDKSVIQDPKGMDEFLWRHLSKTRIQESPPQHVSGNDDKVRVSFIMTRDQINKLKKSILVQRPTIGQVSSFIIVCAHVWTCMAKLDDAIGEEIQEELFGCVADCRTRLDPPIPATYFGNCLAACVAKKAKRDELVGEGGFAYAVELIKDGIHQSIKSWESIYEKSTSFWMQDFSSYPPTSTGVAGSPKFDVYETDFGWGKPRKCEIVSIDYGRTMSLSVSRESKEDIEIGLLLPKIHMDVFETIFTNELKRVAVED